MIKLGKFIACLMLALVLGAIAQNGFIYYVYGGYKGGWFSTAWVAVAHLAGMAACAIAIKFIWSYKE